VWGGSYFEGFYVRLGQCNDECGKEAGLPDYNAQHDGRDVSGF